MSGIERQETHQQCLETARVGRVFNQRQVREVGTTLWKAWYALHVSINSELCLEKQTITLANFTDTSLSPLHVTSFMQSSHSWKSSWSTLLSSAQTTVLFCLQEKSSHRNCVAAKCRGACTQEAKGGGLPWVQAPPGLHSEFKNSLNYMVRPFQRTKKEKKIVQPWQITQHLGGCFLTCKMGMIVVHWTS